MAPQRRTHSAAPTFGNENVVTESGKRTQNRNEKTARFFGFFQKRNKRKVFFFEKKKQKTFAYCPLRRTKQVKAGQSERDKSFLVLFFKKELLLPYAAACALRSSSRQ
jgi:hypothetical protein